MPLYELFCMARPALARPDAAQIIRNVAAAVLSKDGILTDIKSYGDHPLAYTIRRPGQRYDEVQIVSRMCPQALKCNIQSWGSALMSPSSHVSHHP